MRVLMIAHTQATWTAYFARAFINRDYATKVLSFSPERIQGVDTEFLGIEPFDKFSNKHLFFTRVPRVRQIIRNWRPDIVFAPYLSSNGLCAAMSWKGPLVVAGVGGDVLNHAGRRGVGLYLRELSIRYVCHRADLINTVSEGITAELKRLGVPAAKILQMPFGTDLEVFRPAKDMPRKIATRIICTRKHERIYDIPTILQALAMLKQSGCRFQCVFTSGGSLLHNHRILAGELGLADHVQFTGDLNHDRLPILLRNADVYVSASRNDGTSVALLEAMASGLLPVVTRIAANAPWVEDGHTGLLFEPGEPSSLAAALARAIDDDALRRRAFLENRSRVDRNGNMKRNHERLLDTFERIVTKRASR
ncbi:MAG: glycosyltransferase [Kiritimatiellia bacterium]